MQKEKYITKAPLTLTIDKNLKSYIQGPFVKRSLIKASQLTEKAIEDYLKANGHWEHFQEHLAAQETY